MWWHTVTHRRGSEGETGEWSGYPGLTGFTTSEHGVSSITTADARTLSASIRLNWRPPADLNGLVRFAERRNLVSALVPSHFKCSLIEFMTVIMFQMRKFTTLCVLETMQTFTHSCKCIYNLTPELLGVLNAKILAIALNVLKLQSLLFWFKIYAYSHYW